MRAVLLRIVKGQALVKVVLGDNRLAQPVQGSPQPRGSPHEDSRILYTPGQTEELLRQFPCRLELCPVEIKQRQCHQHREELRSLPQLLAQLARLSDDSFHFRGRVAFDSD